VPKCIAVDEVVQVPAHPVSPGHKQGIIGFIVGVQSFVVIKETTTYFKAAMQAILHDGNELLVGQQAIAIRIEDGKHGVDQVGTETIAGADLHSAREFI